MERGREAAGNQQNGSTNKVERKVLEKNRRNQMKLLYSKLNSLLPPNQSTDSPLTVLDQIEEAIKYIQSLTVKLDKVKEKKKRILMSAPTRSPSSNLPELKIKEMGSAVEVVFMTELNDRFLFYEIIRIFHEERAEIINATYSVLDDTVLYSLHAEIEDVMYAFGATKLTERLKRLAYEWKSDAEQQAAGASSSGYGGSHPSEDTPTARYGGCF
ncbi:transcription factor bHLH162-like [Cucurbita moschata]|uniref:Transcription factor bHLH162-like n=1 Tax=Cucurbita moschata TaxID=3662 RepID=A0A6J1G8B1_CUCMO|nr:transcription factor bHLH162-like [Cucurbita moschata]